MIELMGEKLKALIVTCTLAIVAAIIATPFLHTNYTRWAEQDSKLEAEVNDADMAYAHCQNVSAMAGKTFTEIVQLCQTNWDRYRDAKAKYKSDYWLDFLFSSK